MRKPSDPKCPQCGGRLVIDPQCHQSEFYIPACYIRGRDYGPGGYPRRVKVAPAALCTECDYAIEIPIRRMAQ